MGIAAADDHRPGLSRRADRDAAHDADLGDRTGHPQGLGQPAGHRTPGPYMIPYTLHKGLTQHHVSITLQNASSNLAGRPSSRGRRSRTSRAAPPALAPRSAHGPPTGATPNASGPGRANRHQPTRPAGWAAN